MDPLDFLTTPSTPTLFKRIWSKPQGPPSGFPTTVHLCLVLIWGWGKRGSCERSLGIFFKDNVGESLLIIFQWDKMWLILALQFVLSLSCISLWSVFTDFWKNSFERNNFWRNNFFQFVLGPNWSAILMSPFFCSRLWKGPGNKKY